jgi:hypothetical protein
MRITLADQIEEAEIHRDALHKAAAGKPALEIRRDRSEAIVLTLHAYAAFEVDINRSTNTTKGA